MTPAARGMNRTILSPSYMDIAPFVEVRVTQNFSAPADRVFDAWIDPAIAGGWLFATAARPASRVTIDARTGGMFCFVERSGGSDIEHAGEYVEIARPRHLVFTLASAQHPGNRARVSVDIAPEKAGCHLTLVHESVLRDDAPRIEGRWAGMLYGLATLLASAEGWVMGDE